MGEGASLSSAALSSLSSGGGGGGNGDGVWSLLADVEVATTLLIAVAVGAAEFLLEGIVMMHLSGVMGYSHGACAGYLALFNVPNAVVMVLADPFLRRVLPWVSMSLGLAAAAVAVTGLAWLGGAVQVELSLSIA
jgi:hypothetical protein